MANCCVCGNKIGFMSGDPFSLRFTNFTICSQCSDQRSVLKSTSKENYNPEKVNAGREYFHQCIVTGTVLPEILPSINELLEESLANEEKILETESRRNSFKITTGYNFEGFRITNYMNIISGESVLGTGFLSEINAQVSDFWGTSSELFEEKISKAKAFAIDRLIEKALTVGANAIIGVDLDLMTLTNNMIVVSANGTAVFIKKE